jgi:hypothetical protein
MISKAPGSLERRAFGAERCQVMQILYDCGNLLTYWRCFDLEAGSKIVAGSAAVLEKAKRALVITVVVFIGPVLIVMIIVMMFVLTAFVLRFDLFCCLVPMRNNGMREHHAVRCQKPEHYEEPFCQATQR